MLIGKMQVAHDLERNRYLGSQGAGSPNVFGRYAGLIKAIENAKHAKDFTVGTEHGNGEKLFDFELGNGIEVGAGQLQQNPAQGVQQMLGNILGKKKKPQ